MVEILLRVAGITYPVFDSFDYHRAMKLKPGKEGRYDKEGSGYLKINSLGYRDEEHQLEKPEGVFRIAVLGDSFTEARQVEIEETYWKRLESILNAELGEGSKRFEVINFGIGGYGQTEELITLELDALAFSPDLVLLGFFTGNDLVNNLKSLSIRVRGESQRPFYELKDGQLVLDDSFREPSFSYFARRFLLAATHHLKTLEIVNQLRRLIVVRKMRTAQQALQQELGFAQGMEAGVFSSDLGTSSSQFAPPVDAEWEAAWAITDALLDEINRQSIAAGAEFAVVTISDPSQVHPDPRVRDRYAKKLGVPDLLYPERRLDEFARDRGFSLISMVERMQVEATRRSTFFHGFDNTTWGKGHWNREGHALAAEIIAHDVVALGLIPASQ